MIEVIRISMDDTSLTQDLRTPPVASVGGPPGSGGSPARLERRDTRHICVFDVGWS